MGYRRMWRILGVAGAGLLASVVPVTTAVAAPASSSVHKVTIATKGCTTLFCYKPASLTFSSGGRVKWTNKTTAPHTVTRCTVAACGVNGGTGTDPGPSSPILNTGNTYQLTFHGKGTYLYYCQIHGFATMLATITVT